MNKKTFAFLVPAVLLLAACGPTSSDSIVPPTPRSDYTEESLNSSEVGTSSEEETSSPAATSSSEESSSSAGTSSSEESSSSTGASSSQSKPEGTEISVSFRSVSASAGYGYADHPEEFAAFFPEGLLSSSPSIASIFAQSCNSDDSDIRLTVGGRNSVGSIELSFESPVKAVSLVGSDYFNFFAEGTPHEGVSYSHAGVKIGEQSYEFSHVSSGTPAEDTFEAVFDSPVSSLTIESQAGTSGTDDAPRFFLYSLTFVI